MTMGMSRLTALIIQTNGNNIKCDAAGPSPENGKYSGWINLWKRGAFHQPLLNSEPVYESEEKAIEAMKEVVKAVRAADVMGDNK